MNTIVLRNITSHVLTEKDNSIVNCVLGEDRISMCTVSVQIYTASEEEQDWLAVGTGPLCLAHDFQQNTFVLVLIDTSCGSVVWERELTHFTEYLSVSDKFHLLRFDQLIGINFLCSLEAQHFALKLAEIIKYVKLTCLPCVSGHNKKNSKNKKNKLKSKSSQNKNTDKKLKKKDLSIKFGITYITKCCQKLLHRSVSYEKLECDSHSSPTSPRENTNWKSLTFPRSNSFCFNGEDNDNVIHSINSCHE